jgi:hypothetical protein
MLQRLRLGVIRLGATMAIKKQEFYEGAALYLLLRTGMLSSIRYDEPFFLLNNKLLIYLKYSTRNRSPWGFTFAANEQSLLAERCGICKLVIGLVCGGDGVAAIDFDAYRSIAALRSSSLRISCHRKHGKHYDIWGPDGKLSSKVAPSSWIRAIAT